MNEYILILIFLFLLFVLVVGSIGAFVVIKIRRRAKEVERSLKLVPLQLKIPPQEVATEGRDIREIIKENISKAEGVYRLLSGISSSQSWLYGQRYIGLEIIASGRQILFYVLVPATLISAIKKALVAGYPNIQIEQNEDINFFSKTAKIAGVVGGEFVLSRDSIYPINTYQMSEQDALNGILSGLSNLSSHEGAGIQILIRPASSKWIKRTRQAAKQILNPDKKYGFEKAMDISTTVLKAPFQARSSEDKALETEKQPDIIDQKKSEMIEEKVKYPAFETLIRVIASSDDINNSRAIIDSIKLGMAQFSLHNSNSFKFIPASEPQSLAKDFIFRYFPINKKTTVLNSVELATVFHLPSETLEIASPVERSGMKEVAAPHNLPAEGLLLGTNFFQGKTTDVRLSDDDRRRHIYIIGQTGTGKSVFLENCVVQDMQAGKGVAFIDPHGDTAEKLMAKVPPERAEDVIYFNPGDTEFPMGWNLMEYDPAHPEQKDFLVQEAIQMLYKLYDPTHQGIIGPRFESWFRNAALTVMADPEGGTFIEIPKVFTDDEFLKSKFQYVTDPIVQDFWTGEMAQTDAHSKSEMLGWFVSKFGAFANNEIMRNIIGQKHSAFNLRKVMDEGKILFVNLSKGLLGDLNSQLLGVVFVIKFQMAAMSRASIPEGQRRDFTVYIDEFQNYSTDSIATILSEARKYRLSLVMANQFISQLDERVRDSVFGNVGSIISFRVGPDDAEYLTKQFAPAFDAADLVNIQNHFAAAKIINAGVPTAPFSLKEIMPPLGTARPELLDSMKDLSRSRFAKPKADVENEILNSLGI